MLSLIESDETRVTFLSNNRVRRNASHFSQQLRTTTTTTTTMFFLAFLLVAGLATIIRGDGITQIMGNCRDLEATLMIKYLLFFYVAVQFSRG